MKNRFGSISKEPQDNVTRAHSYQDLKIIEKSSKDIAVLLQNEDVRSRWPRRPEVGSTRLERRSDIPHRVTFAEGIFMGYRWLDKQDVESLFPFAMACSTR